MSILGQVREPIIPPPPPPSSTVPSATNTVPVGNSQDQFDSYLTKLQNICSENGGSVSADHPKSSFVSTDPKSSYCSGVSTTPVVGAPKTALQPYNSTSAKL